MKGHSFHLLISQTGFPHSGILGENLVDGNLRGSGSQEAEVREQPEGNGNEIRTMRQASLS